MSETNTNRGRVTIPTDVDVVPETLELLGALLAGHPRQAADLAVLGDLDRCV